MPVKQKEPKSKHKALKMIGIIISILLIIAIVATIFITVVTRPVDESSDKAVAVGGMITSESIDYKSENAEGLEKNPVVKIMQMVWRFINDGDAKKHEKQTPPVVEEVKDIPYLDDGNRYHLLDVYYPENTTEKLPVIIDIHGGGWMYADKNLNEYYCKSLADRGFVVFNIRYRLVPDVTVNEQIQDCALALKWIGENMADYPCDTENIMLTGDSAGGQLAAYSAVLIQSPELRKIFDTVDPGLDITALLLTSPVANMKDGAMSVYTKALWGKDYKDKPTYEYMNLDEIIDYAKMPPTYLITSSGDSMAHSQTLHTAEMLESKGVEVVLKDYEKFNGKSLPHVFSVLEPFDEIGTQTIDDAVDFYREKIAEKTPA
ncbi:MAG: alpha/beta hydrolase [Eubacterium sp.]